MSGSTCATCSGSSSASAAPQIDPDGKVINVRGAGGRTVALHLIAAGLFAGCFSVGPTDRPATSSRTPTPEPSGSPPVRDPLATAGWFRLIRQHPDQDSLAGFELEVGTLDGRLARTVSIRFGPLAPSAAYRGALPIAAGPFGDTVLFAFWDGASSEIHSVSVTSGEDVVVARRDDIVHALTLDPRTDAIFALTLDPGTRAERGIVRIAGRSGPGNPVVESKVPPPTEAEQVWKRLWVAPDGSRLVVVDCPTECFASVHALDGATLSNRLAMASGQDVVGVTNDALLTVFGCEPPCPATSYDLATGTAERVGIFCEAGTIVSIEGKGTLVSDRPIAGDCRNAAYPMGRTDLGTGIDAVVLQQPTRDRTLIAMNEIQGATQPEGWFLIGPSGQLVGVGAQAQVAPRLVRARDGATIDLPLLGAGGG